MHRQSPLLSNLNLSDLEEQIAESQRLEKEREEILRSVVVRLSARKENAPLFELLERVAVQQSFSEDDRTTCFLEGQRALARYILSMRYKNE